MAEKSKSNVVEHKGKSFFVCDDGFLITNGKDPFCGAWMDYVRVLEGIPEVTDEHLMVVDYLRVYHDTHGGVPAIRILSKDTGLTLLKIYELFPSGPGTGACKMAGLPKPSGCSG